VIFLIQEPVSKAINFETGVCTFLYGGGMMKLGLVGYGKMGRTIERMALEEGHCVTAIVDPARAGAGTKFFPSIAEADTLKHADVVLEFTGPASALANIKALAALGVPTVTGSTGWYDKMEEARAAVVQASSALVWASNYALGINLLYRIAAYAAGVIGNFPEYDMAGYEAHHNQKADSPSGTAKTLAELLLSKFPRKKNIVWDTLNRKAEADELHFPSLRIGAVPGTHAVIFDSPEDTLEIIHRARNRDGLARGALKAAQWLISPRDGKPKKGFFAIDDLLADILG
jgi:4-hydroxy-tetrahydrodipicolinate reductase